MIAHANIYSGIPAGRKLHYGRVAEPRISDQFGEWRHLSLSKGIRASCIRLAPVHWAIATRHGGPLDAHSEVDR